MKTNFRSSWLREEVDGTEESINGKENGRKERRKR